MASLMIPEPGDADKMEFVGSVVRHARTSRLTIEPVWEENYANYRVEPVGMQLFAPQQPGIAYYNNPGYQPYRNQGRSVLKSAQSHQIVEAMLSKIIPMLLGGKKTIVAEPMGREDVQRSKAVTKLIRYCLDLYNHHTSLVEWIKDALIFGTGIVEVSYAYEKMMTITNKVIDMGGERIVTEEAAEQIICDDPRISVVSLYDFYPDPSETCIGKMNIVVKRFTVLDHVARQRAKDGVYKMAAVDEAIANMSTSGQPARDRVDYNILSTDRMTTSHVEEPPKYRFLEGYEAWCRNVPWEAKEGMQSRVLTYFKGGTIMARDQAFPFNDMELPFIEIRMNPVANRFWGISPLEVTRYQQDLADTLMMARADAVVRETKGSWKATRDSGVDEAKLRTRLTGEVHFVDQIDSLDALPFTHTLENAYREVALTELAMQNASGATEPLLGASSSGDQTATEFQGVLQQAMTRVSLIARMIERDAFPRLAKMIHSRYLQFLGSDEKMLQRIGEEPMLVTLEDIQGSYNFRFVGSTMTQSQQARSAALREAITVLGSLPNVAAQVNWTELIIKYLEDGLEIADFVDFLATSQGIVDNVNLQQILAGGQQASIAAPQQRPQGEGRNASDVGGMLS